MQLLKYLKLGTPGSKYIPTWFQFESVSVREHLLAGVIDSDGHLVQPNPPRKGATTKRRQFTGTTPHQMDKHREAAHYKHSPVETIYFKIAEGLFALARSLSIPYSTHFRPPRTRNGLNHQASHIVTFGPCSALRNILSLCAVESKSMPPPPGEFIRYNVEFPVAMYPLDAVVAVHQQANLPHSLPEQDIRQAIIRIKELHWTTVGLLTKRHQLACNRSATARRIGVGKKKLCRFIRARGNDAKIEYYMQRQLAEQMPMAWIDDLITATITPVQHMFVDLHLDPTSDGLFLLSNNVIAQSK